MTDGSVSAAGPTHARGADRLRQAVRTIPDFPKPGILFRDIAPVLADPSLLALAIEELAAPYDDQPPSRVVAVESRGFVFGVPLALRWGAGFVPVRKAGKLPGPTRREAYELEYGEAILEIQADALRPGDRVLIIDDVLATGGTATAAARLVRQLGAEVVGHSFLISLVGLGGEARLRGDRTHSVVRYD